ncbi:ISL3 family transposase [Pseudomonas sp. ZM23]|uniref:ISL3 family transposase n=1 Tax=Pseudomonas triclosanedens TaxID=2961893 RepID=A0ABY7A441_9PSED|nr:ISL3 family transposase [Pseudomonas triclosanedens]MCP8464630.1 ISL3 family transposase [Pseudomonas triclosanedens]WAI50889.1 ISL3 family transposase [Pseudomonas triclosanedens]
MNNQIETLFTTALGLQSPWEVVSVELNTGKRRIDFQVAYGAKGASCPACAMEHQLIHDRIERSWRHLDFFQFEAWLHAEVPRVRCSGCGKTTQLPVPWAREGSGFTLLFEALGLSLCRELPVSQAARQMRVSAKRLWRRVHHYVTAARTQDDMSGVRHVGIDETSVKRGHEYITLVHDLQARRLLFACPGRDHTTIEAFATELRAHGGDPDAVAHVCIDMSAAYTKGVGQALPNAQVSYDRFHVVALANAAMDEVRREEMRASAAAVREALGTHDKKALRQLLWGMRKDAAQWTPAQLNAMHWLQRTNLKSARAWRLKQALRHLYREAANSNSEPFAQQALTKWMSWARRCRLEPFKRLAQTLKTHLGGVVRGMLDGRSNAYVEAMNGLLQQTKTAARGFRDVGNFIAVAYLRMSKLKHLPANPLIPAISREIGRYRHVC